MCTTNFYRITGTKYTIKETNNWEHFTNVGIVDTDKVKIDEVTRDKCGNPIIIKKLERIPCGNCMECRLNKSKEWAFRCVKEAMEHDNNIMITLTYDDDHLPRSRGIDPKTGEIYESSTLVKKDHQDFMKRLRKKFGNDIRFFMCGEYGSDDEYVDKYGTLRKGTERPHYHFILFNCKFEDMKFWRWSKCEWSNQKNALYRSKTLDKLWGEGHAELNEVNFETCRYVAGYVAKKYKGSDSKEHYELKGQIPPYTCMSRKPGIANAFFEKNMEKFFKEQPMWVITKKGMKKAKSRYFDKQMEKVDPERYEEIKEKRKKKADRAWENLLSKTDITMYQYIENSDSKSEQKNRFMKMRNKVR